MEKQSIKQKLLPLILTLCVILVDQLTKILVVQNIPPYTIGASFFNEIIRIIHVSNEGIAFSVGDDLPNRWRAILFSLAPCVVIVLMFVIYFRNNDFTKIQRWMICGILGGGIGNLIDRIFRAEGVIDFIDIKFWGLLGMQRWPTFNVADSAVVVCGIILVVLFIRVVKK